MMLNPEFINRISDSIRQKLVELSENAPSEGSFEAYEMLVSSIRDMYETASLETLKESMSQYDYAEPTYVYKGETYRLKYRAPHHVLTPFGKLSIERNVYQDAEDKHTAAPLDIAMGFHGENMTLDVRNLMATALTRMPAEEVEMLFRTSGYRGCPHPTQIKKTR